MTICSACRKEANEGAWREDAFVCADCWRAHEWAHHLTRELISPGPLLGPHHEPGRRRINYASRLTSILDSDVEVWLTSHTGLRITGVLRQQSKDDNVVLRLELPLREALEAEASTSYESLRSLQETLEQRELRLWTCGNCACFRFSSMSYQMSLGTKGYCTIGKKSPQDCGRNNVVSIFDVCDAFHYGPRFVWG